MARPSRWTTPALGYSPRRDGTAAGASTSSGFRKCAPMPHRGQETVTRVLRLSRRRDILRRTRPTRVYPHCARHVSRSRRLSVVCTPRYDACATKVIVRGAHAGPRTLGHPPSGCGIDPRFLELHRHRLQSAQAPQRARADLRSRKPLAHSCAELNVGAKKRREFIVLVDGAGAASQDGSIASVYLRPCDPGDRMLRWHPRQ